MKRWKHLLASCTLARILEKTDEERGAGDKSYETKSPASIESFTPTAERVSQADSIPQRFKKRSIPTSLKKCRIEGEVYDDTAMAFKRICEKKICGASLVRAMANIARLLEDELSQCTSEVELEKVFFSHFKL